MIIKVEQAKRALEMEESYETCGGLLLRTNSEYQDVLRHYSFRGFESGIYKRIQLTYFGEPYIKIGLTEPEPLGLNNMMSAIYIISSDGRSYANLRPM